MRKSQRDMELFKTMMKGSSRLTDVSYKATTAKRVTVCPPAGVSIFDTDLNKWFIGDGSTYGGISDTSRARVRKIVVNAAASGGLTASATTDKITWTTYGAYLRTGDAITLAAGTGTLPSGVSAATVWVVKDATSPTSESFRIATSRANAIAETVIDVLGSGEPGWTSVIQTVCAGGFEDVLIIDPVGAAVDVCLPDADSNDGVQVTVKRAAAGSAITVKELASDGTVSASGDVTIDDAAGYASLTSGSMSKGSTYFADGLSGEWFTIAKVTS